MPEAGRTRRPGHQEAETFDSPEPTRNYPHLVAHLPTARAQRTRTHAPFPAPLRPDDRSVNAPDSTPGPEPRPLSDDVRSRLREAIDASFREGGASTDVLRAALRDAATEARARGLRPEELVIALQALLDDTPGGAHGLPAGDQLRIRERILSACISAYFRQE